MNNNKKILMVGSMQSIHPKTIVKHLRALGADVIVLEPYLLNGETQSLIWRDQRIYWQRQDISFTHIQSIFLASRASPVPLQHVFDESDGASLGWESWFQEYGLQRDRSDTLLGVLLAYERAGVPMINAPSLSNNSRRKPYQISVMKSAGCPMPETLVTNDTHQAKQFINYYKQVIVKPAAGGALTLNAHELEDKHLAELKYAPAIFQRRIDGKDLRIMVLDGKVISSVIINVPDGTLDFRGDKDYESGRSSYTRIKLPTSIEQKCIDAAEALGLRYTGIDIKLTNNNEYYFLECNSGPMYLDVERKTGDPITSHICGRLMAGDR